MKVHFIGIGGVGMSALAIHMKLSGEEVSGSNIEENDRTLYLKKLGVDVRIGHRGENVPEGVDLVVVSRAVPPNNPELLRSKKLATEILYRDEVLKDVTSSLKPSFAITGTDGKTTTTAMLFHALRKLGENPYGFLGGTHPDFQHGNYSKGERGVVYELDESVPTFALYEPDHLIVTNIRGDHVEKFGSFKKYLESFRKLAQRTKGIVVGFHSDENASRIANVTFGVGGGDFRLIERETVGERQRFTFEDPRGRFHTVDLGVPGFHNCLNALAVISLLSSIGYPTSNLTGLFSDFVGVHRRFTVSYSSEDKRIFVIDDYAHTPKEIETLLRTVREVFPSEKLVAVFQPHRYSRVLRENGNFAKALRMADEVYITEIYGAFEEERNVSSRMILEELLRMGRRGEFVEDPEDVVNSLRVEPGTVYVFIGAGDIIKYSGRFVEKISSEEDVIGGRTT